jgi:hypothetical protein
VETTNASCTVLPGLKIELSSHTMSQLFATVVKYLRTVHHGHMKIVTNMGRTNCQR